jgi:predicted SAM-dependent methyltransferase
MKLLNLGCGQQIHRDWTNIDFLSDNENIISFNLLNGIPFGENEFDVVYHSHLLEHFSKNQDQNFLKECYRVLKVGGVIRIAIPDLEQIIKEYLHILTRIDNNDLLAEDDYTWIMLELYDQTVRNYSGGMMSEYISQQRIPNEEFIYKRIGQEGKNLRAAYLMASNSNSKTCLEQNTLLSKIKTIFNKDYYSEKLVKLFDNKQHERYKHYFSIGRFRESGEIHQWMYDKYSAKKLLLETGFKNIVQRTAFDSYIDNWCYYNLDTSSDGSVRKPDSFFMEAVK